MNRCLAGPGRCAGTTLNDAGERQSAPVEDANIPLCEPCIGRLTDIVESLLLDWDALRVLLGEKQSFQQAKVTYTRNPSIPLAVDPEALQVELVDLAEISASMVSRVLCVDDPNTYRGRRHPHPKRQQASLGASVALLTGNVDRLLLVEKQDVLRWGASGGDDIPIFEYRKTGPKQYVPVDSEGREIIEGNTVMDEMSGVDIAMAIWELHGKVRAHFGTKSKDRRELMPTACPMCSHRTLYRYHGEDLVKCTNCIEGKGRKGWIYPDEYNQLEGYVVWMQKRAEEQKIEQLEADVAAERQARAAAEQTAAQRTAQLERVARFAGKDTIDDLLAVLDQAGAA